ncbi:MAG: mechanosensitive ion channel [archaeon]|nr:mechanosensitive ion channel [archaeon]
MYKGRTRFLISIIAVMTMLTIMLASPALSDDSAAASQIDGTQLSISYNKEANLKVNAGNTISLTAIITNNYSEAKAIYVFAECDNSGVSIKTNPIDTLEPGKHASLKMEMSADKYAHQGDYTLTVKFGVDSLTSTDYEEGVITMPISVSSNLSASEQYNRFMGIWDNNLPAPFDDAWFAALITGLVWIIIGYFVRLFAVPIVMGIIMKKDDEDYEPMKRALVRMCFVIIVLNGIGKAIRVLGMSEDIIDAINRIFYICYILVAVLVLWHIYLLVINYVVKKIGVRDFIPGGSKSDFESLKPLFVYIGEIVFAVFTIGSIMSLLGFNMTAIVTSAGIVSLGITMGAQNVLSQFFSGLVILATRPFKAGDMITLNGGSITYRVRKINVMFTEFENWDNTDITIIPNSSLTSGVVKNITKDTLKSKVHIFMDVGYGTDLAYARAAMLEVANANPRVIKDGSVSRPSTRVVDFLDSNIRLRLSVFVDDFNDSGVIGGELRQALYNKFNEKGINIDYQQIVIRAPSFNENDEK